MKSSWMLVAGFMFACMGVFVKLGAPYFSSTELVFYRSIFGLVVIWGLTRTQQISLTTSHFKAHFWRGISGFAALMLFFYSIVRLPLATAVTLHYTAPLFLAALLTVVLKERPQWSLIVALLLGFVGVTLLLQPTFQEGKLMAGGLGLFAGFLSAVAYLNIKKLGLLGEPEWRVVFYFTLICTVGSGLFMIAGERHAITMANLWILLGLSVTATLAQLALTRAYHTGKTLVVANLAYSTVVFASLLGFVLWGEALSWLSWGAILLIVISGLLAVKVTPRISASAVALD